MKTVRNTIEIWKSENDAHFFRTVSLGPCPHCHGYELIVSDVELRDRPNDQFPMAVQCGGCGASGPWDHTEEGAVLAWNNTTGVRTVYETEWRLVRTPEMTDDETPF